MSQLGLKINLRLTRWYLGFDLYSLISIESRYTSTKSKLLPYPALPGSNFRSRPCTSLSISDALYTKPIRMCVTWWGLEYFDQVITAISLDIYIGLGIGVLQEPPENLSNSSSSTIR
jgi:hypothetical protein